MDENEKHFFSTVKACKACKDQLILGNSLLV